jgi:hypothetical protein
MPRLLPALLLLLAACSGADAKMALNTPVIDTLPGGIVRVTNPGPTAWADTSGWQLVLEREIIPAEGSEGEVGSPRALVASEGGAIYWLMTEPSVIKAYAADGTWLRNIGREGDGPGEFRDGMFGLAGDKLFIQDPNNSRLTVFDTSGTFLQSAPSQCCYWTNNFPIFGDGTVGIMGPAPAGDDGQGGALYVTRLDGTVIDTVVFPPSEPNPSGYWTVTMTRGNNRSQMRMGVPLQPTDYTRYRNDRTVVRGNTATYSLAVTGLNRDTTLVFTAPATQVAITTAQRDSIFADVVDNMNEQWRDAIREAAKPSDIPTAWPLWTGVVADPTGHVWVSRPNPAGGTNLLDVFSPEGVLLGTVAAPTNDVMNGYWTSDRVYVRGETDEGYPKITVYRIARQGGS